MNKPKYCRYCGEKIVEIQHKPKTWYDDETGEHKKRKVISRKCPNFRWWEHSVSQPNHYNIKHSFYSIDEYYF